MNTDRIRRRPVARAVLAACLGLATAGCESELPPGTIKQVVEVGTVPANVRDAAAKALPGVTLSESWKNVDPKTKDLHSYELRGRAKNGKIREVRVSPSGEILEQE